LNNNTNKCRACNEYYRYHTDNIFRTIKLIRGRLRSACYRQNISKPDCLGIDYQKIANYLGPKPNDGKEYHIDHIIPISFFDLTDPKQIKQAFAPENHQWLEKIKNLYKSAKLGYSVDIY
jgi:hypothetical protein